MNNTGSGIMGDELKEKARLHDVFDYEILDSPAESELEELAKIASVVCAAPISLITIIDEHRQWFKVNHGMPQKETPRSASFCQHALHLPKEVLVVSDALQDERFKGNPLVLGEPYVRFYAGAPLETPSGHVLGTLCVLDTNPRDMMEGQRKALQMLAKKAMDFLNARRHLLKQKMRIELNAKELMRLTDEVPGVVCQFQLTGEGQIHFHFISKGIVNMHPDLHPDAVKTDSGKFFEVIHKEDLAVVQRSIQHSFSNQSNWTVEFRVASGDQPEWHIIRARPEIAESGEVVWYGFILNISNRVEYEKTMEQIAFDISHVLRRPVTTLLGLANIIETEEMDVVKIKQYMSYIKIVSSELDQFTRRLNETYRLKTEIITGRKKTQGLRKW